MKERGHGSANPDDELLRHWYAVSGRSTPAPSAQLLARREPKHRRRVAFRNLIVAAVAFAAVIAGVAGGAVWASFRSASASSGAPATGASISPTASRQETPTPTVENASGPDLAEHEYVAQMQRTSRGGWLLTRLRLRMLDGTGWRDCWSEPDQGSMANPRAVVAGSVIRINSGVTLWKSTDDCAGWTQTASPGPATGLAFPTESVGYIAYTEYGETNQAHVYRTMDGGQHWAPTAGQVKAQGEMELAFADAQHGWLTDTQTLWRTTNGGGTWVTTSFPVPASVRGRLDVIGTPVVGADGTAVVVVKYDARPGMDGAPGQQVFFRTQDLGAHWVAVSVVSDPGTLSISMVDPTTWVVLDPSTASLQSTRDGGATWRTVSVHERWPFFRGPIAFADSLHGWMVVTEPNPPCPGGTQCDYLFGPPEHLVATDDGGMTWVELKP
jgi:photosystem II stability/assembly factor-like uncharacterized protein